jgi:hypothetical protein
MGIRAICFSEYSIQSCFDLRAQCLVKQYPNHSDDVCWLPRDAMRDEGTRASSLSLLDGLP